MVFIVGVLFLLGLGTFAQAWGFCGLVVGMVAGIFSRDSVWIRRQRIIWPFYARVIDWEKVQKIARGEASV